VYLPIVTLLDSASPGAAGAAPAVEAEKMGDGSTTATSGCQTLTFRGVRGSVPTPNAENLGYGGNTPCLEIRGPNNELAICDAGSGIRDLGHVLSQEAHRGSLSLHIFLTHYHWDHIQGLPVFAPLFQAQNKICFYASERLGSIQKHLRGQMDAPYFPVKFDDLPAHIEFVEMNDQSVAVGDLRVTAFPLNHPQGASGFRIESQAAVIVYASDLEHTDLRCAVHARRIPVAYRMGA
jgi:phosphoribosyl 1,2-cyclic phosphodiesterase